MRVGQALLLGALVVGARFVLGQRGGGGGAQAMGRARFDDVTGAPLNAAAREILARHDEAAGASGAGAAAAFADLRPVDVASGTWKFVLLECEFQNETKAIVRALANLKFHAENFDVVAASLKPLGVRVRVVGGGRTRRDDAARTISVYGYSETFGRAPGCNERAAAMIRAALPDYAVDWSDAGY